MKKNNPQKFIPEKTGGEIIIYKTSKNEVELKVRMGKETILLTQQQVSQLFDVQKAAVSKHVKNIFDSGELKKNSTVSILETVQIEGDRKMSRKIEYYNLDLVLAIGYRVHSKQATKFRIWATKTLKNYLIKGYVINEKRLLETQNKFHELQEAVLFLQEKSKKELLAGQEGEILSLLSRYAKTLTLLDEYDKGTLKDAKGVKSKFVLTYENCVNVIRELRKELIDRKEAGDLFGSQRGGSFEGIIKGLYQTFGDKELYPTVEDKASHLLYLTIKDHTFSDGNKRLGAFLFVYFLDKSDYLYRENGERKIHNNALTALALLTAESNPKEKETMIKLIKNLISG